MYAPLVYPRFPVTHWGLQYGLLLMGKRAALPLLGLPTGSALLPSYWHVRVVDLDVNALHDDELRWAAVHLTEVRQQKVCVQATPSSGVD